MAAPQPQQQGGGDNSMTPVWIALAVFIAGFFIWELGHQYIVGLMFQINLFEAKFINFFIDNEQLKKTIFLIETIPPETVNWDQFIDLIRGVGDFVRYPVIVIFIILSILLYRSDVRLKFKKVYSMKTLREQEQYNWYAIMPIVKEDLVSMDISQGPWAMGLSPMEFARKYKLLKKEDALLDAPVPGQEMTAGVRKGDAKRVFTLQLGPYWDGFEHCPPQAAALAAVFMARMNRDRHAAASILELLDKSYATGKIDFSVAKSILKKYQNTPSVQEILSKHAYLLTVMPSLLEAARDDGVVPSAEFLWLKPIDRRLWYMLNSVGRQTPFSEVAGPFAHWRAEKVMGRRSLVPMIDTAIKALEVAIKEIKLTPKELQELEP